MKSYLSAALVMAVSAQGYAYNQSPATDTSLKWRPITETYLWLNTEDNGGSTRKVDVKRVNKYISPGVFNQRRWDRIQACLSVNANSDQWYADAPHPHYKADLQMIQVREDPCDELD